MMFNESLNLCPNEFLLTGLTVSVEDRLILGVSLSTLKRENRFASVSYLGKLFGINGDYYIAYGRGKDYIRNKMFFYSLDGQQWRVLFPPSADELSEFRGTRNRFTGDPTEVHRFYVGGERKVAMREENRLSATIHLLDWETAIGPKGALQIEPRTGGVRENPYFEGLLPHEMDDLKSYVHHRLPWCMENFIPGENMRTSAGDAAINFLEPITEDYPPGCWLHRSDPLRGIVQLHSLWWPGHSFYIKLSECGWGSLYMGLGDRNDDLPFML